MSVLICGKIAKSQRVSRSLGCVCFWTQLASLVWKLQLHEACPSLVTTTYIIIKTDVYLLHLFLCIKLPQLTMQGVRTGKGPVLILRQKRRIYNHLQPKQFCKKRSTQEPKKKPIPSHQNIPKKFCARFLISFHT